MDEIVSYERQVTISEEVKALGKYPISYSQYSMYSHCPYLWKQKYVDKVIQDSPNIYTLFGHSMHHTIQTWITEMFSNSIKKANEMDLESLLKDAMATEYSNYIEKGNEGYSTNEELSEFFYDGLYILDFLKKKRGLYFSNRGYELIGVEVPIKYPTINENVIFIGYADLIIKDSESGVHTIYDIKTSTRGWNKWQKDDEIKMSQILLYKYFYSKQYNVPIELIDVQYFITKRKLYEQSEFPQKRIQIYKPAAGPRKINAMLNKFNEFITTVFDETGKPRVDIPYEQALSSACKFCQLKTSCNG